MTLLETLKKYFENTPREQILKDWAMVEEETKNIQSPTVEEFMLCIIGSPFYCYDKTVANAQEDCDFKQCEKQCEKCKQ